MNSQSEYFSSYKNYVNLLKDIFNKLPDNKNKVHTNICRQHITNQNTMYENITYIPFDSKLVDTTPFSIELTIKIYTQSLNYESFDNLYRNEGQFLNMLSPHNLQNELFFLDGTKKYKLNNIFYRIVYYLFN